jgi:hypothetical protein
VVEAMNVTFPVAAVELSACRNVPVRAIVVKAISSNA